MKAAIYARYSSENQRPESIKDQVSACRKLARERGWAIPEDCVFMDQAASGARKDRTGLSALLAAAEESRFTVVLVDDLSRLARDNYLMLSVLGELRFKGVRVVSVADGLDSDDEEATLGIQIRGIFNELQLQDLRKKTLRGQLGQKERGFFVGERTFGYRSVPVGEMRLDKKGRPRPDGYRMEIEPSEAEVVLRVFREFADGRPLTRIVKRLNEEGILGQFRSTQRWSPATVTRILRNEKYAGRWIWNRTETRRDPRTGRRRPFPKPESEWVIRDDECLRIVPKKIWDRVQEKLQQTKRVWPGRSGQRGFEGQQGSRVRVYPTQLLSGAMTCGACGNAIAQVSGKAGGYYGCLGAAKKACDNRLLVRRTLAERLVVDAVRREVSNRERVAYLLDRVAAEVKHLVSDLPETLTLKKAELEAAERKLGNFVEFIGQGRGSRALADALEVTERRATELRAEVAELEASRSRTFEPPAVAWVTERLATLQQVLERRTERSALLLRKVLGPIRLEPVRGDIGKPFYRARTSLDVVALLEDEGPQEGANAGSNALREWSQGESNPRLRRERPPS